MYRDMLSGIAASIRDLSNETKLAFSAMKETLQLNMTSTEKSIASRKTLIMTWLTLLIALNGAKRVG